MVLAGCVFAACTAFAQPAPEAATGFTAKPAVLAQRFMVVAAHPLAAEAGHRMLAAGGSAVDAAVAAQMVLGLVEPQSSGIGGGGFALVYAAGERGLRVYDGREVAPAGAGPDLFLDENGAPLPFRDAVASGRSVGVPGLMRMLEAMHRRHGRLPWAVLFEPAIELADRGFPVSARLAALIARDPLLARNPAARGYFFEADGRPRPAGALLRNPELARTLRALAAGGAKALHEGEIARDIVKAVAAAPRGGRLRASDLAAYRALERAPLCRPYRTWEVCGVPPPAGGIGVHQTLGLLERFPMHQFGPESLIGPHLFIEASRLAYADRDRYLADPAHFPVPTKGLLDRRYLADRSASIALDQAGGRREAGVPPGLAVRPAEVPRADAPSTTHLSIVDAEGNAVALTSSIESAFGSRRMVRGFLLNNQLTDFSFVPDRGGAPVANRAEGGKRPRSAMSPTIVFDRKGRPVLVLGSPGGPWIIGYVARTLVAVLDWGLDAEAAVALPHFGSRNGPVELERGTEIEALRPRLEAFGHEVRVRDLTSGLAVIQRTANGWLGAADPRREGAARGE